ncbi:MAG TPA: hypothetical protein VEF34_14180 [Syntrophobacteraceae bacterium]|nr:hypothetical protein [Syntrophobacteraceae bacterium]
MKSLPARIVIVSFVLIGLIYIGSNVVNAVNVNPARHPHLADAQKHIEIAIAELSEAQRLNDFDMQGHAAEAKKLLEQAYNQIKLSAEAANVKR